VTSHSSHPLDPPLATATTCLRAPLTNDTVCFVTPAPMGERSIAMKVSVCLCMCLSVRDHVFGTTRPICTKFLRMLPMAVARSRRPLAAY